VRGEPLESSAAAGLLGRCELGKFSEAQAVIDPALLQRVFAELAAEPIQREGGRESGLRLQIKFNLWQDQPVAAQVSSARVCERALLRSQLKEGEFYIGESLLRRRLCAL
jgi:ribosomal 30S subunit maturation factor RimM